MSGMVIKNITKNKFEDIVKEHCLILNSALVSDIVFDFDSQNINPDDAFTDIDYSNEYGDIIGWIRTYKDGTVKYQIDEELLTKRRYNLTSEIFFYDTILDIAKNSDLKVIPTIVLLNKMESLVNKHNFAITVFGEGDEEYGKSYEAKLRKGFNDHIYTSHVSDSRTKCILECFDWFQSNILNESQKAL